MADKNMEAQISVEFEEATSRQSLNSGDKINTLWSKVKRWLSDLKAVAFSGSYNDLSDTPSTATTDTDGLMSAEDKTKLDDADNRYASKSLYRDTTINVGRKAGTTVGEYSSAEGWNTTAIGSSSHAEGRDTAAYGESSHAEGWNTTAIGSEAHAEGDSSNKVTDVITDFSIPTSDDDIITAWNKTKFSLARGLASHVEGYNTLALAESSHAEGSYTKATKNASHAEGKETEATGDYSHAEGDCTKAIGNFSHSEGYFTRASGGSSHAEGNNTTASGDYSHAEGYGTTASGKYSSSHGSYTKALHDYEVSFGKFNESNDDTLFSIGDGTADDARHNAFEITTTGGKLHDKDIATVGMIPAIDSALSDTSTNPVQNKAIHRALISISQNVAKKADIVHTHAKADITDLPLISNPNLLINPDFKVNQRGGTSYTSSSLTKYTVDRWVIAGTCTPTSTGVTVSANGSGYGYGDFLQILENYISGQTVTVSTKVNGSIYQFTGNTSENFIGGITITDSDSNNVGYIRMANNSNTKRNIVEYIIYEGCQMEIEWVKLEYGSVATPFIPPDPTTELLKCKRYFEVISRSCKALSPDDVWIDGVVFDVPKRIIPSISITSLVGTPNTLSTYTGADSTITLSGVPNVGFDRINGSPCNQAIGHNAYSYICKADAEIY